MTTALRYAITTIEPTGLTGWQHLYHDAEPGRTEGETVTSGFRIEAGYLSVLRVATDQAGHEAIEAALEGDANVTGFMVSQ